MRTRTLATTAALLLALTACGGDDPTDATADDPTPAATEDATQAPADDATDAPDEEPADEATAAGDDDCAAASPLLRVLDSFAITGRDGDVVTGQVLSGTFRVGDTVDVEIGGYAHTGEISGIEEFREVLEEVGPGANAGIVITGHDTPEGGVDTAEPGTLVLTGDDPDAIEPCA